MNKRYAIQHEVTYYECDINQEMTIPSLLSVAIKASTDQSDSLDRGFAYVSKLGLGWVITQTTIAVTRMPKEGEQLLVETMPTEYNRFFCYRDFWVKDLAGDELVKLQMAFVLMDVENRKIASATEAIMAPFDSVQTKKIKRWPKIRGVANGTIKPYRVRFYDLDGNRHVNNARYFNWIIDSLDYDFLTTHRLKQAVIKFDKEIQYGHEIASHCEVVQEEALSLHEIRLADTLCCEANLFWEPRSF